MLGSLGAAILNAKAGDLNEGADFEPAELVVAGRGSNRSPTRGKLRAGRDRVG